MQLELCHKWMVYIHLLIPMDSIACAKILRFLQSKVHENFAWELGFLRNFALNAAHPYLPL